MPQQNSFIRPDVLLASIGVRAEQTFVHLGCGPGFYVIPAAKIVGAKGKAFGIDILPDKLAEVENRARQQGVENIVHTLRANLESASGSTLPEKSADWVLVANILHQSDPAKIFAEAARIVAVRGNVAVVEWSTAATPLGPPVESRPHPEDVRHAAELCGLALAKEFVPSPYHFGFIFSRQA